MTKTMGARRAVGAVMVGLSAFALAACGGKPSEGDIKDKMIELWSTSDAISKDQAQKLADCMAPKMEDNLSEDALNKIMDAESADLTSGNDLKVSKEDEEAMSKIVQECAPAAQ